MGLRLLLRLPGGRRRAENQKVIGVPDSYADEEKPYYLPDDMADKAIGWLHGVRGQDARKPSFMYFATGCSHSPHHVAEAWAAKYKGKFDQGWDKLRWAAERSPYDGPMPDGAVRESVPTWHCGGPGRSSG